MPTRITFEFEGELQLDRRLERFEAVADARPVWDALADRFARANLRQFATEGAASGNPWDPLSPVYAAWKAKHYPGQPILRRDDDLWRGLTQQPFGVDVREERFAIFGSATDHGRYHQAGAGNLPQRRPVDLSENERRTWVRILQKYIVTGEV